MNYGKFFCLAAFLPLGMTAAELPAPVTEVQIFRNNSAMIRHEAAPNGAMRFTVSGNFSPLEGTLWSSSEVKQIRKTLTEVSRKEPVSLNDITATYKNQFVTLVLNNGTGKTERVNGTVLDVFKKEQPEYSRFVALKSSREKKIRIIAVPRHQILRVESAALKIAERVVKEQKQAWEFTMARNTSGKITFDYLAKTLNWIPSFKLTLLPNRKFSLTGAATVVNTGDELKNARCILWAGAPNIENSALFSPMAIVKKAIPVPPPRPRAAVWNRKNLSKAAFAAADGASFTGEPSSAPDIADNMAPFDAGRITLKKNEALVRTLGSAAGTYENLVRWRIPARQADNGRQVWKTNNNMVPELWECLRFLNPFKYAIPDAAVEIADGSRVLGQIKGTWVNPGERVTWEITRCRDVKATFAEQEAPSSIKNRGAGLFQRVERGSFQSNIRGSALSRDSSSPIRRGVYNGIWYRVTDVKGTIDLKNYRKRPVNFVIEMDYFGEFVSASAKPARKVLNHFGSLNPKNQLIWKITLKPGESRKLDFRYNIIINR